MKMRKFELWTEAKNVASIDSILGEYFLGYSREHQVGVWDGGKEPSLHVELLSAGDKHQQALARGNWRLIADRIKMLNSQEAVLIAESEVEAEFV